MRVNAFCSAWSSWYSAAQICSMMRTARELSLEEEDLRSISTSALCVNPSEATNSRKVTAPEPSRSMYSTSGAMSAPVAIEERHFSCSCVMMEAVSSYESRPLASVSADWKSSSSLVLNASLAILLFCRIMSRIWLSIVSSRSVCSEVRLSLVARGRRCSKVTITSTGCAAPSGLVKPSSYLSCCSCTLESPRSSPSRMECSSSASTAPLRSGSK
mmetsp:Transcript_41928/g.104238  ORF Transcript_41928/g.104238 Transcript_41928/m.104238 type:complete len:215 (-) Transcript_41928:2463-3107(-)